MFYSRCLAEQGVEAPSGAPGAAAPDTADAQPSEDQMQAFQACQQYMPEGMPSGGVPPST